MFDEYPALVLNADFRPLDYFPLSVWNWKEAISSVLQDRVTVVLEHEVSAHSPTCEIKLPSVIALRDYVERKHRPSFTRVNLIALRDRCCCGYCGQTFPMHHLTYDHVIPRSRKGVHRWENVIAACLECNQRKADRTPEEARMPLLWRPWQPTTVELARADYFMNQRRLCEGWQDYVGYVD